MPGGKRKASVQSDRRGKLSGAESQPSELSKRIQIGDEAMINRRNFIAACVAAGGMTASTLAASTGKLPQRIGELDWACEAVQTPPASLKRRSPVVTGVCLSADESYIAVVGDDHLVSIYDLGSRRFRDSLSAHRDWVRAACFSPDNAVLATAGNDRMIFCWNPLNWEQPLLLAQQPTAIFGMAFAPGGEWLATVGFSSTLYVYDIANRQERRRLECPCEDMRAIAFSRDGKFLAAGGRCGTVRVWEVMTGKVVSEFRAHRQRVRSLQYNEAGQILSCGEDQLVALTDPFHQGTSLQLPQQASRLFAVTLLEERICATSGSDNRIAIWNLESRELLGTLSGHTGTVSCLTTGDRLLVSGSYDTQIRIWQRAAKVGQLDSGAGAEETGWSPRIR
jgi:hypothetical protein